MAGTPGYLTSVKKNGVATAMTSEAMSTYSTAANTYKITSGTKRIWVRDASFTFYEATATGGRQAISTAEISSIDYLFGNVTFGSTQALPVTVTGQYYPVATVAGGNSYTLTQVREQLEDTDYSSTGYVSRKGTFLDSSVTISRYESSSIDQDFYTAVENGTPLLVEIIPGGYSTATDVFRGYYLVEAENRSGDVAGLETADLTFQLDHDTAAAFGWGST